jgi:hemerythrin
MTHYQWSSDLDTGIEVIDAQHKRLVQYINDLYDAKETGDKKAVVSVINGLIYFTVSHFSFEESLMDQMGYPYVEAHNKAHGLFSKRVNEFVERFDAGEDVIDELTDLLNFWLINHIKNEDGDYALFARKHDIQFDNPRGSLWSRVVKTVFG